MARDLPPLRPVTLDELRAVWTQQPDPAIQHLALEVVRYRDVIAQIDQLYKITTKLGAIPKAETWWPCTCYNNSLTASANGWRRKSFSV